MEFFVTIKGDFENYEISNLCRVRNKDTGRIIKMFVDKYGYGYHSLSNKGFYKKKKLHRLMALAFIPNPLNKKEVNHKDGNPLNNSIENLEWVTHFENQSHKVMKWKRSSQYLGVTFNSKEQKWRAQIQINNKKIALGSYKTEAEAYQARVNFEKLHQIDNKYL